MWIIIRYRQKGSKQSYAIGDRDVDVEMVARAVCKAGIRVGEPGGTGDWVVASFSDAVEKILGFEGHL